MDQKKLSTLELVALTVSSIIVATNVVYWIVQIKGVREMLKLAAGG